jgi:hypothetical protein
MHINKYVIPLVFGIYREKIKCKKNLVAYKKYIFFFKLKISKLNVVIVFLILFLVKKFQKYAN